MTNPKRKHLNLWLLLGGCLVAIGLAPLLYTFAGPDQSEDAARRERIAQMTKTERERLHRRFQTWQNLPAQERQDVQDLHAEIGANRTLARTLDQYTEWLYTLDPWQQEELRNAPDSVTRMRLVHEYMAAQEERGSRSRRDGGPFNAMTSRYFKDVPLLPEEDLDAMFNVVAKALDVPKSEQDEWSMLEPIQRHAEILKKIAIRAEEQSDPRRGLVNDAVARDLALAIRDPDGREYAMGEGIGRERRSRVLRLLIKNSSEEVRQLAEEQRPDEAELEKFFFELDQQQRDEVTRLQGEEQKQRLTKLYFEVHGSQAFRGYWELGKELMYAGSRRGGGRSRGPRGGPGGADRRPPSQDRNGERGDPGRGE